MRNDQIRQGDVLLQKVSTIPAAAKKQAPKNGRVEIEWGEVSTHCHRIEDAEKANLYLEGTRQYLEVCALAPLVHEEHSTIELEPAKYQRRKQFTYDYAADMAVQAFD